MFFGDIRLFFLVSLIIPDSILSVQMFNAGANSSGNSLYYRRMRRDRSYVAVQGTGRILGQRWFAWMELLVAEVEPGPMGVSSLKIPMSEKMSKRVAFK